MEYIKEDQLQCLCPSSNTPVVLLLLAIEMPPGQWLISHLVHLLLSLSQDETSQLEGMASLLQPRRENKMW